MTEGADLPINEDFGLTFEEVAVLRLHDKPPQELDGNTSGLLDELKSIRLYQMELMVEAQVYCNKLCK